MKMGKKNDTMDVVVFRLPPTVIQSIKALAGQDHLPMSTWLRVFVTKSVIEEKARRQVISEMYDDGKYDDSRAERGGKGDVDAKSETGGESGIASNEDESVPTTTNADADSKKELD